ncbi:MAG: hypothetical protein AAFX99_03560, partial [Myxococcota bacterium]
MLPKQQCAAWMVVVVTGLAGVSGACSGASANGEIAPKVTPRTKPKTKDWGAVKVPPEATLKAWSWDRGFVVAVTSEAILVEARKAASLNSRGVVVQKGDSEDSFLITSLYDALV